MKGKCLDQKIYVRASEETCGAFKPKDPRKRQRNCGSCIHYLDQERQRKRIRLTTRREKNLDSVAVKV